MNKSALKFFRTIAIAEGISFLILLFIAMPLKYIADQPLAVKYTGWAHGILFVLYMYALLKVWMEWKWEIKKVMMAFIASLLPFGTFYFDNKYLKPVIAGK